MFQLPTEIQQKVYEYDPTNKEKFNQVLHQIEYIMVMKEFKRKVNWYKHTWHWQTNPWWFWFLKLNKSCYRNILC